MGLLISCRHETTLNFTRVPSGLHRIDRSSWRNSTPFRTARQSEMHRLTQRHASSRPTPMKSPAACVRGASLDRTKLLPTTMPRRSSAEMNDSGVGALIRPKPSVTSAAPNRSMMISTPPPPPQPTSRTRPPGTRPPRRSRSGATYWRCIMARSELFIAVRPSQFNLMQRLPRPTPLPTSKRREP